MDICEPDNDNGDKPVAVLEEELRQIRELLTQVRRGSRPIMSIVQR